MKPRHKSFARHLALSLLVLFFVALSNRGCTNTNNTTNGDNQRTFSSPNDAVNAFISALRAGDKEKLHAIFGEESDDLLSSGDAVADRNAKEQLLQAYDEKHELTTNSDGSKTLTVGKTDWPLPIPLVQDESSKAWVFDTEAGKDEIINRRVGRNELTVIEVCKAIGDAEREYAARDPNKDGIPEYARKFISSPGTKDGLYWQTKEGEEPSPLGEAAADAQAQGYSMAPSTGEPRPYHGYYYRILTAQGKDAPGGAQDYVVNGKLIGGYAVVAWPADYGNSGVMTFITNYQGDVYQKDLGDDTDKLARAMTEYNPDSSWKKTEEGESDAATAGR